MLTIHLMEPGTILALHPHGVIEEGDIDRLRKALEDQAEAGHAVRGLLVNAAQFPGYADVSALMAHLGLIREFHRRLAKVALVTDAGFGPVAETLGRAMLAVDMRHFPAARLAEAEAWLRE